MKVVNKTEWRTDQLKAIISRVAAVELEPKVRKVFTITVEYTRQDRGCTGYAFYHSTSCVVRVPPPVRYKGRKTGWNKEYEPFFDKADFARTVAHEMAHTRGVRHHQMRGSARYTYRGIRGDARYEVPEMYAWAREMPVEVKPVRQPKVVPAEVIVLKEYEHARAKAAEWTRKLAVARRKNREWKAKTARLARKAAAFRPQGGAE